MSATNHIKRQLTFLRLPEYVKRTWSPSCFVNLAHMQVVNCSNFAKAVLYSTIASWSMANLSAAQEFCNDKEIVRVHGKRIKLYSCSSWHNSSLNFQNFFNQLTSFANSFLFLLNESNKLSTDSLGEWWMMLLLELRATGRFSLSEKVCSMLYDAGCDIGCQPFTWLKSHIKLIFRYIFIFYLFSSLHFRFIY